MFICKDCHDKDTWAEHFFFSYGPCEICRKAGKCADCHDSAHDKPRPRSENGQKRPTRI